MPKESSQEEKVHTDNDRDLGHDILLKALEAAEAIPRRVYIMRRTLEKYGCTAECAGCTTAFFGGTGVNHTESCPMRVGSAITDDTVRAECKEKRTGIRAGTYTRESQEIRQRRRRLHGLQTGGAFISIKCNKFFTMCYSCRHEEECRTGC